VTQLAIRKAFANAVRRQSALVDDMVQASSAPGFVMLRAVKSLQAAMLWDDLAEPLTNAFFAGAYKEEQALKAVSLQRRLALEWAQNRAATLVTAMRADGMANVQDAVANAIATNATTAQLAADIKSSIGLLPRDVRMLKNLRRTLKEQGLNQKQITKLVDARKKKAINARALSIARTEMTAAREAGKLQAWLVRAAEGKITDVKRKWVTNDPCSRCQRLGASPAIPLNQPFRIDGIEIFAPPLHTNCKCRVRLVKTKPNQ